MSEMNSEHLIRIKGHGPEEGHVPCVALTHNEMSILPEFLDHYRRLGPVQFAIVDDRSDDGSHEFLLDQPDVTLFEPKPGSTYAEHKRQWRRELLDTFGHNRWCLVPDIDEHLIYADYEMRGLDALISALEAERSEALHCTMLDMYTCKPLADHTYEGGGLLAAYPMTDAPDSYFMLPAPTRYARKYPTPTLLVHGGMRSRLFFSQVDPTRLQSALISRFAGIDGPFNPGGVRLAAARVTRRASRALFGGDPFISSKLTLLKWRRGLGFSGGSHSVTQHMRVSERAGVLLHFKFTKGIAGLQYLADRRQHAGGGRYYRRMLETGNVLTLSPCYGGTIEVTGSASLSGFLR
jgi:hypothetical protein